MHYNSSFNKYNELYNKVLAYKSIESLPLPKIVSQEESIRWSSELKKLFASKLIGKKDLTLIELYEAFSQGINFQLHPTLSNTQKGLAAVNALLKNEKLSQLHIMQAKEDIYNNNLFFDFNSIDDLFIETKKATQLAYEIL